MPILECTLPETNSLQNEWMFFFFFFFFLYDYFGYCLFPKGGNISFREGNQLQ